MSQIRDIGAYNPYSMQDGVIFPLRGQLELYSLITWFYAYNYYYRVSPKRFKVHRSGHAVLAFGISVYLPYRYNAQVNTVLFSLTKSANPLLNKLVRLPTKLLVYGTSIFAGQCVARLYWTYKRSYNASQQATLNAYLAYKHYSNSKERYPYTSVFEEVRPKLVS